ncbi:MAG: HAMP domain-containing histidine kinase [Alphaproteobacteria bacterium]|nr:HAMP domain-containing histidine kinase [Alphaproteobacteria bacterium]MCB9697393.1 HAMP domain-containing histidine kinase [Alphaproteobacteria bacterium]
MATVRDRVRRALVGRLARRRGEVRANQDFRFVGQVARLAGVFAVTMLLPIAFLAILALTSIRSEELSMSADLDARARTTSAALQEVLVDVFERFQLATFERLRRGEDPTGNLGELSPYLRAAFRFDADGRLAAPFRIGEDRGSPRPPVGWHRAERQARTLEAGRRYGDALEVWRRARATSREPTWVGEAMLGEARCLAQLNRLEEAQTLLGELYSDLADVSDSRGFHFGDLVRLELATWRLQRGQLLDVEAAESTLDELVESLLTSSWTLGEPGEPTVLRHAMGLLEQLEADGQGGDPDRLARQRSRMNERMAQFEWAGLVENEVDNVFSRIPPNEFKYLGARQDSAGVWALVRVESGFYAFSFSVEALVAELRAAVERTNEVEPDLVAHLEVFGTDPVRTAQMTNLGPWLPGLGVMVEPRDPEALARSLAWRRAVRVAIVFTSVFVAVVGAIWVARMVAWEVENARQRADFAANVSHELRSPITQIRLKGEALQLGLVDPGEDMQQHFDAIVRESERLSRLVDNVLDFAAIERGTKSYQLRKDDLAAVVAMAVETARAGLEGLGMEIEVHVPRHLPLVEIDRDAIGQVLINLLSNAGKYAASGKWVGVTVSIDRIGWIEISVADRGMGIAPDELPKVFEDFFRSSDPRVRRTKGTGIGLAIVRYIVEAHGGTISVDSPPGKGATFTVLLPSPSSPTTDERS